MVAWMHLVHEYIFKKINVKWNPWHWAEVEAEIVWVVVLWIKQRGGVFIPILMYNINYYTPLLQMVCVGLGLKNIRSETEYPSYKCLPSSGKWMHRQTSTPDKGKIPLFELNCSILSESSGSTDNNTLRCDATPKQTFNSLGAVIFHP